MCYQSRVKIPRIVVDANVLVGAFLSKAGGDNREVIRRCLKREAQPLLGVTLFSEYEDVLGRDNLMKKCPLAPRDRLVLLEAFLSVCEWVKVYYLWRPNLPDEGDAHLKNFSLLETLSGDHALSPAYDLLCTTLHLPNESRLALDLFHGNFATPFFDANGFHGYDDFLELSRRCGMAAKVATAFLLSLPEKQSAVHDLIDRSFLSEAAKARYRQIFDDRLLALRPYGNV